MVKRVTVAIIPVLILLTAVPVALASSGLSGRFRTTISSPASIKGVWTISFYGHHQDSDYLNGKKVASGTYTSSGSTISFAQRQAPTGQKQCLTPGKYRFTLNGGQLTFAKISDPCNPIRSKLLSHRFSQL